MERGIYSSGAAAGEVLAGRYRLGARIGRGGFGEVREAEDLLTGEDVAVKLVLGLTPEAMLRIQAEVAALRLLRVPGVARCIDEGALPGGRFLVMERVRGVRFPGGRGRGWEAVAPVAAALLETLARVHERGLVHRDVKPDNVLVSPGGQPVLLDFGLAGGPALDAGKDTEQLSSGTFAYASPEQLLGRTVDGRADLYSFGVMLFEALTGRLPFAGDGSGTMLGEKLDGRRLRLSAVGADVPKVVDELVHALLAGAPEERPASAAAVLRALEAGEAASASSGDLLWLGSDDPIRAVVARARDGRPVRVAGAPGSGRSRVLEEAARRLEEEGRAVVRLAPESAPFESLSALAPWLDEDDPPDLDAACAAARRCVARALGEGVVVVADAPERLDRHSREALAEAGEAGALLTATAHASAADVVLAPLEEADLRALFSGPDRLLHLQEDAARELFRRSHGEPARLEREVRAWVRAGLATDAGGTIAVGRAVLDRLAQGLRVLPPGAGEHEPELALDDASAELLACVELAWPDGKIASLAAALSRPSEIVEAQLGELEARGAVVREPDGTFTARAHSAQLEQWGPRRVRALRATLADGAPPGSEARVHALLAGEYWTDAAAEALEAARLLWDVGHLGRAEAVLLDGLFAARAAGGGRLEPPLLRRLAALAVSRYTSRALDQALYETLRSGAPRAERDAVEAFLRAAQAAMTSDGPRALVALDELGPQGDRELEGSRQSLRVRAARGCDLVRHRTVVREIAGAAELADDPDLRSGAAGWLGLLRYREGAFEEAAALHTSAASGKTRRTAKLSDLTNAASALLEASRPAETTEIAERVRVLAAELRNALFEARAEWLLRAAAYRAGEARTPDLELAELSSRVSAGTQEPLVCLTEGAFAWRAGDTATARELAERAARSWAERGQRWSALLARALAVAAGAEPRADELAELGACPLPRILAQVGCLYAQRGVEAPADWRGETRALASVVPVEHHALRFELLSIEELVQAAR